MTRLDNMEIGDPQRVQSIAGVEWRADARRHDDTEAERQCACLNRRDKVDMGEFQS
jgi:hypothetical protein